MKTPSQICNSWYFLNGVRTCSLLSTTGCQLIGSQVKCGLYESYMKVENRRNRIDLFTPAETAIYKAQEEVEKLTGDERLTNAGSLLSDARSWVADFIEDVPISEHYPRPVQAEQPEVWNTDKVIDFVNWHLRMCKVITDSDCRFELENQNVIDSFLKGDDYKLWWRDDIADKRIEELEQPEVTDEEIEKWINKMRFDNRNWFDEQSASAAINWMCSRLTGK